MSELRTVDEWIGATPDTALPDHVYLRIYRRQDGRCTKCTRKLRPGNITREHLKPIWAGGENCESNIALWCSVPCSTAKTSDEAAPRAKGDRMLKRHLGLKRKGRPLPGTKRSPWKHKADGTWVRRTP